jgi:intein-encoded DNA endonuclease-like protein
MKKRDTSGLPIKTLEDYLVEKETKYNTTRLIIFCQDKKDKTPTIKVYRCLV